MGRIRRKELVKKLEAAGFELIRNKNHAVYKKESGRQVQVPNHTEINEKTAKAILKAAGLV